MFHKTAFLVCGGYLPEERHGEDFGLWGRMVDQGAIVGVPHPLLDFRVHHSSISKQKADVQIPLSLAIAQRHCREFMHLNDAEARRALYALRQQSGGSGLRDWCWLITHCLPRLKYHSIELWLWVLQKTLKRLTVDNLKF
jgi:hypothetical protein